MDHHLFTLILLIGYVSTSSSRPACCQWQVVTTEKSLNQTVTSTCRVTLRKLIELESNQTRLERSHDCSSKELNFQPGVHYLFSSNSMQILYRHLSSVIIRGIENATIKCSYQSNLKLNDIATIKIQNICIDKCSIINQYGSAHGIDLSQTVEIINSTFTNTTMTSYALTDNNEYEVTITIDGITAEATTFKTYEVGNNGLFLSSPQLTVILRNINVRYNDRPFIDLSGFKSPLLWLTGNNCFLYNNGIILHLYGDKTNLYFSRVNVYFINNSHGTHNLPTYGPPIYTDSGTIQLEHSHVTFMNNQGGITAVDTNIIFGGNVTVQFTNNSGLPNGGALSLHGRSTIIFNASSIGTIVNFTNNKAGKGGAIYVKNSCDIIPPPVFDFQCDPTLVKMTFSNNSASYSGNHIYGGWVDWTIDSQSGNISYNSAIKKSLIIESYSASDITSCPVRICLCKDGHHDCSITNHSMEVYGQAVTLSLLAVGQRYTPIAAYVNASLMSDAYYISYSTDEEQWQRLWPRTESLLTTCTKVTYTLYSDEETILFEPVLKTCCDSVQYSDGFVSSQYSNLFMNLSVKVTSRGCPLGFKRRSIERTCICDQRFGLACEETNTKIIRKQQQWIGVTYEHTKPGESPGVITYSPCPFDYCRTNDESLQFNLEDEDVLCAFNRHGILCGGCEANFSRVMGSSKCKECSNNIPSMIALFLGQVLFALIVVIALILLDLTVTAGTINGLNFYANIICAQHATFFTQGTLPSFLSIFITTLNLDEGIEFCLYDGLDEYAITWLKIPLPMYMWIFAGVLIFWSQCSTRFSKLIGKNSVQVLATLFLISYTRLLQLVINVFSYMTITYPDGYVKKVWYIDGNVEYLTGKHIPLFLVTVFFLFITLPYTAVLLSIQLVYKVSHYRLMFWVQRLKPLFDAYTGPYKPPHRYWTGLLLVVRTILLTVFATSQSSINLLSIIVISVGLIGWCSLVKGVYESSLNNFLEVIFLCNLAITSAAVLFDKHNTKAAIYTSTSVAFITFVCIIFYHAVKQMLLTKHGSKFKVLLHSIPLSVKRKYEDTTNQDDVGSSPLGQSLATVTSTIVELKEPLLEDEHDL